MFLRRSYESLSLLFVLLFAVVLFFPQACFASEVDLEALLDDDFDEEDEVVAIADPLEPMNRVFFTFNDKIYYWVLKPTGKVYSSLLAEDVRNCISDAFYNILAPVRVVNHLLQGEFRSSGFELSRFFINTTLGAGGLGDPAAEEFGIMRQGADFGQTLGKYGIGDGFYLYWPIVGPSSARDTIGLVGDYFLEPLHYGLKGQTELAVGLNVLKAQNESTLRGDQYEAIMDEAFDPYVSMRDIYVQYRRGVIGNRSKSGRIAAKRPDSFRPKDDCPEFNYSAMYANKIRARHHEQCQALSGSHVQLVRFTQGGTVYYGVDFPDRY